MISETVSTSTVSAQSFILDLMRANYDFAGQLITKSVFFYFNNPDAIPIVR